MNQENDGDSGSLVKIFIRTGNKKARGILLPREITEKQLKKIASSKTHIPIEELVLFNQGSEIKQKAQLESNNIIHAIDLRSVNRDSIHFYVKMLDKEAKRE